MANGKTPLVLICGFLGSGKTTLVNRLLAEGFGTERVAIIVNDFGNIAIDAALIDHAQDGMLALTNGCICCSLAADLMQGLKAMLASGRYDRIIMETSGVTSMYNLQGALEWEGFKETLAVERIIVVADATRYTKLREHIRVIEEQARRADIILLNRCDLADEELLAQTEAAIREVNTKAPILRTTHSQVSRAQLDLAPHTHAARAEHGVAQDDWFTGRVHFDRPVAREELETLLGALPAHVHRLKGFVQAQGKGVLHVERAGEDLQMRLWTQAVPQESLGVLVAIGSSPIEEALVKLFGELDGARVTRDQALHAHEHEGHHGHDHEHNGHGHEHHGEHEHHEPAGHHKH